MTEHKFTDEEVIKALECCKDADCENCPRYSGQCADFLPSVLDLINRQKAEIEKLTDLNKQLESDIVNANMNLEHITYEFDLLEQEKSVVRAEAIKEFAERLQKNLPLCEMMADFVMKSVDKTVKEMTENSETKENKEDALYTL